MRNKIIALLLLIPVLAFAAVTVTHPAGETNTFAGSVFSAAGYFFGGSGFPFGNHGFAGEGGGAAGPTDSVAGDAVVMAATGGSFLVGNSAAGGSFFKASPTSVSFPGNFITSVIQSLSGAGAVNLTTFTTKVTSTGADALTLANGTNGQIKCIVMVADGGDATLTPTTKTAFSTITFNDVGDSVTLQYYTTLGWMILSNYGATVTP